MSFNIAEFPISDENITKFRRWVKKPNDCVINALEVIGALDQLNADLMRIVVGDIGINIDQIHDLFKLLLSEYNWRFIRYTNMDSIVEFVNNTMSKGFVIFCGYATYQNSHVFLIWKRHDDSKLYIDPQIPIICDLTEVPCYNLIGDKHEYYILQFSK